MGMCFVHDAVFLYGIFKSIEVKKNVRCVKGRVRETIRQQNKNTRVPARHDRPVDGSEIRRSPVDMVNK